MHGSIDVGLAVFPDSIGSSPLVGELVMTGPHSGRFSSVWYVLGADTNGNGYGLTAKILAIGVNKGEWESIGPGKIRGWHHIAFYDPSTDTDGDGFPNLGPGVLPITPPGELPELTSFDTRISAP